MRVKKKYKIRHSILTILFNKLKYNDVHFFNLTYSATSVEELATTLNLTVEEILTAHHGLTKHINCNCASGHHIISISADGIDAYIDNFWLREGQKDLNERIYDRTKWTIPVIALIVTIGSLVYSTYKTDKALKKVDKLQNDFDNLKNRIANSVSTQQSTNAKNNEPKGDSSHLVNINKK